MRSLFKSSLNEISRGRFKSEEQKIALENIKLLYKSRKDVPKLFNDYSSIWSEAKYKSIHGEGPAQNINSKINASKIINSSCTSKTR